MAVHLLKYVNYRNDLGLDELALHYVRDKEKREADFLICRKRKPLFLIEAKTNLREPDSTLEDLAKILGITDIFQISRENHDYIKTKRTPLTFHSLSAASFLKHLV